MWMEERLLLLLLLLLLVVVVVMLVMLMQVMASCHLAGLSSYHSSRRWHLNHQHLSMPTDSLHRPDMFSVTDYVELFTSTSCCSQL